MSRVGQRRYSIFSMFPNKRGFFLWWTGLQALLVSRSVHEDKHSFEYYITNPSVCVYIYIIPAEKEEYNPSSPASLCSDFLRVFLHSLIFSFWLPPNSASTRRSELWGASWRRLRTLEQPWKRHLSWTTNTQNTALWGWHSSGTSLTSWGWECSTTWNSRFKLGIAYPTRGVKHV